jgi:hypothetical protein
MKGGTSEWMPEESTVSLYGDSQLHGFCELNAAGMPSTNQSGFRLALDLALIIFDMLPMENPLLGKSMRMYFNLGRGSLSKFKINISDPVLLEL